MSQKTESAHAATLRDLGFSPVDPALTDQIRSEIVRLTGWHLPVKKDQTPTFTRMEHCTLATDDLGQTWTGPLNTDLSFLGFMDMTEEYKEFKLEQATPASSARN